MNKNLIQKTSNDLNIIPITRTDNLISNGITNNITDNIIDNNVNNISNISNINNEVLTKKIIHKTRSLKKIVSIGEI